ncbi:alpha-hydroxy-acid oxidizing protein [Nitratireductor sp. GCM10026969]|uniref:alpha-hydroxy-acid oxidizing protein n=1 Tax=Nitratireductor sp. GCM10026969 TaxID=3252645 RepID=UPI00360A5FC1
MRPHNSQVGRIICAVGLPASFPTPSIPHAHQIPGAGAGAKWFQLYVFRDRDVSQRLLTRARALGFKALEVTVDNAIPGGCAMPATAFHSPSDGRRPSSPVFSPIPAGHRR